MKRKNQRFKIPALFAQAALSLAGTTAARAGEDFGTWHALSLQFLVTERWTLSAVGQLRFRDESSELYAYQLSPQVVYKIRPTTTTPIATTKTA